MRFHANYVSTSVSGDYLQAVFEAEKDSDDPLSPYLLFQRQFEVRMTAPATWRRMTRSTSDIFFCAESSSRRRGCQSRVDRPSNNLISVTFSITVSGFEDARQVVRIISGEIEPQ